MWPGYSTMIVDLTFSTDENSQHTLIVPRGEKGKSVLEDVLVSGQESLKRQPQPSMSPAFESVAALSSNKVLVDDLIDQTPEEPSTLPGTDGEVTDEASCLVLRLLLGWYHFP